MVVTGEGRMCSIQSFRANAAAERNRRHAEKVKGKRRQEAQNQATSGLGNSATETTSKSLEELQRKAREKLAVTRLNQVPLLRKKSKSRPESVPVETKPVSEPVMTETTAAKPVEPKTTREDRLAELKRKSQKSKDNAKLTKNSAKEELKPSLETEESDDDQLEIIDVDSVDIADKNISSGKNLNVFKTIQSVDKTSAGISKRSEKTRRIDKRWRTSTIGKETESSEKF